MTLNALTLNTWIGKNVRDFCREGGSPHRVDDGTYHCAHFVAHVLGLLGPSLLVPMGVPDIARRCRNFRRLNLIGAGSGFRYPTAAGLAFVTLAGQLRTAGRPPDCRCTAIATPSRHVGFYLDGQVWHYENSPAYEQVVSYPLGGGMAGSRFRDRYGPGCEMWLADLPPGCVARGFAERLETQADLQLLRVARRR